MNTDHHFFQTYHSTIIVFTSANFTFISTIFNSTVYTITFSVSFVKRFCCEFSSGRSVVEMYYYYYQYYFYHNKIVKSFFSTSTNLLVGRFFKFSRIFRYFFPPFSLFATIFLHFSTQIRLFTFKPHYLLIQLCKNQKQQNSVVACPATLILRSVFTDATKLKVALAAFPA